MNLISEFVGALKARVSATVQSLIWGIVAAVAGVAALAFFVAALHTWLAQQYGSVQASLLTTLMAQSIGPKQTSLLMLAALVAGWLMARPRQRGKE